MSRHWNETLSVMLLAAFILGIVLKALLPVWGWLLIAGAGLIYFGYRIFID